jgi:hypothetical protein
MAISVLLLPTGQRDVQTMNCNAPYCESSLTKMGHAVRANAAESKAALAARCRNLRRGSFMAMLLDAGRPLP